MLKWAYPPLNRFLSFQVMKTTKTSTKNKNKTKTKQKQKQKTIKQTTTKTKTIFIKSYQIALLSPP